MFRVCLFLSASLFVALVGGISLGVLLEPAALDWPWYGGKSRAAWLLRLDAADPAERAEAVDALAAIGPAAVPTLIEQLAGGPAHVRDGATAALGRIGAPAFELLRLAYREPRYQGYRPNIRKAVVAVNAEALPALVACLQSADPIDRDLALTTLSEVRPAPGDVLPALQALMERRERSGDVMQVLSRLGPAGVVPLLGFVRSDEPGVHVTAVMLLGNMGRDAAVAVPALLDFLETVTDESLANAVGAALAQIEAPG